MSATEATTQSFAGSRVITARKLYLSSAESFDPATQETLERDFFAALRLRNGTYKFTYAHRFDDLNALVETFLPAARPLKIMDVAVSSGVSTLEWMQSLERGGIEHHMTAGDLTAKGFLISLNKNLHVLVDGAGYPLQFDIYGVPVPNPPGRRYGALYFLPLLIIKARLAMRFRELRAACASTGTSIKKYGIECRPIALVSPRLGQPSNLEIIEDDVLSNKNLNSRFDVLRAANILNRAYFDDETLVAILINLRARLLPDGLFIVCRTNKHNENNATVFTLKDAGRFVVAARLGEGSEVEDLILNLP